MSRAPSPHGTTPRARTASQSASDVLGGTAELDPVLARVAGPRDHDLDAVELAHRVRERRRLGQAEPLERARPLDGEEPVLVRRVAHLAAARLALLQPGVHGGAVRRVDDEEEAARAPRR